MKVWDISRIFSHWIKIFHFNTRKYKLVNFYLYYLNRKYEKQVLNELMHTEYVDILRKIILHIKYPHIPQKKNLFLDIPTIYIFKSNIRRLFSVQKYNMKYKNQWKFLIFNEQNRRNCIYYIIWVLYTHVVKNINIVRKNRSIGRYMLSQQQIEFVIASALTMIAAILVGTCVCPIVISVPITKLVRASKNYVCK